MSETLGFIGLGVMGEPICRNIASKSGKPMVAYDLRPEPLERLAEVGVRAADSVAAVAREADLIFLSLPGGEHVREVVLGDDGLLTHLRAGATVVDTSTCPVDIAREVAARLAERGIDFADAPVARTRAAAEQGTLSIMVGAEPPVFERVRPLLAAAATEVTHCGAVGCGQVVKILNNMVLFETVMALAEAQAIGCRAGVEPSLLFDTLSKGSADSFALRNHGMKAMVPGVFPKSAFATDYALKDLSYALRLAEQNGVRTRGANAVEEVLNESRAAGYAKEYFPALVKVVDGKQTCVRRAKSTPAPPGAACTGLRSRVLIASASDSVATSLKRGLQVLRAFGAEDIMLSNNEIVERTGLPKSTVARLTYTLSMLGYLHQEDRMGRFRLGDEVVPLGHKLLASLPVRQIAQPLMQEFADHYGVSVALAVGNESSMLYLVYCHGRDVVARRLRTGSMVPMGRTAIGRAYLSALPPARRALHIARIAAEAGEAANQQVSALDQSFKDLDRDGFYCAFGEWRREIYSVGAPVILDGGETVLGLNCGASHQGFSREQFREVLGPELVKLSTAIANTLSSLGRSFWDD